MTKGCGSVLSGPTKRDKGSMVFKTTDLLGMGASLYKAPAFYEVYEGPVHYQFGTDISATNRTAAR